MGTSPLSLPISTSFSTNSLKAAANAKKLGANPKKGFIIGGTSAGGNISAVLGLLARDEHLSPPLTGLCLLVPAVMDFNAIPEEYKSEVISYQQNKDAPILGLAHVQKLMQIYKPDRTSSLFNIFVPPANHANLPTTYFQVFFLSLNRCMVD
jgi:acetyl esterase/lipase